ncbi:MAG: argininosuccinate lyase, partial [Rhodothermales bacterium]|nr:argininosuccinate lyase [Rhodothermales bacterium]
MKEKGRPIWFKGDHAEDWVTRFTVGDDYLWDRLLLPHDIDATRAHARGLVAAGVLDGDEFEVLDRSLSKLRTLVDAGEVTVSAEDEDCHSVIEGSLTEELGDIGRKIHTGRSRNDQVLAALRLFLRGHLKQVAGLAAALAQSLCDVADAHQDAIMPGYTHLQRAMPSTAGLWAAGYAELLAEDAGTVVQALNRMDRSPLGSAAGYGVPYLKLPRQEVSDDLGFRGLQTNVTAVQLSRGKYELQVAHACVQVSATLNRMASDLVLFSSSEFGFVLLPEEYCTGSSIMPQKKNPDVLELARATYHRLVAEMNLLITLPANLPSGYHRDMQLTKEAVMRVVTASVDLLSAMQSVISGIRFDRDRMRAACSPELFATAEALRLVMTGVPFREAYRRVAKEPPDTAQLPEDLASTYLVEGYPGRAATGVIR